MKGHLTTIIRKLRSCQIVSIVFRLTIVVSLIYFGYYCLLLYQKWNIIPTHKIEANLSAEGLVSDKSYCNLRLRINAGNSSVIEDTLFRGNTIVIGNSGDYTDTIALRKVYDGKCRYLYQQHPDKFVGNTTFYYLDFQTNTNIESRVHNKDYAGVLISNKHTLSYIEQPKLTSDSTGTTSIGSGLLGFCQCDGGGELNFATNLLNSIPELLSPWDITQAIYEIQFTSERIKCDTVSIEFIGATDFSSMYPVPDKITMSGIEFLDPIKISIVQTEGLRFHADFLQLKEMSARRTFLLSAVFSLLISIVANLLFRFIFK